MRLLAVEDDSALLLTIKGVFESESYQVDAADNGDEGYLWAKQQIHDLVVLDVMLPGMSGVDIVHKLRAEGNGVPILMLTAKDAITDRVTGLDAGADDYLTKPFSVDELLARSRALLRRRGTVGPDGDLIFGPLRLSSASHEALIDGKPLHLSSTEFKVLEYLMCNKDRIITKEQIFIRVWGFESNAGIAAVDVYVSHLRKKLAARGYEQLIRTVRGIGYTIKGESDVH